MQGSVVMPKDDASKQVGREYWLTPAGLSLVQGWARDGLTDEQIAGRMGISRKTLWVWRGKHMELEKAMRCGKEVSDYAVESALFKNAVEGNVTAQMFWLRNRKPAQWNQPPQIPDMKVEVYQHGLEVLRQSIILKQDGDV